jgi:hypothetical protein
MARGITDFDTAFGKSFQSGSADCIKVGHFK